VRLADVGGLGRTMPLTMGALTLAGLGLIGVPGTAGFISKWYLALGALEAGSPLLVALIVASSIISVVYMGRVFEAVWFGEATQKAAEARDPPLSMLLPLLLLAAATIYLGLDTRATAGIGALAADMLIEGLR
jgi:multicomponent Na+:H+ antiporter subunit D